MLVFYPQSRRAFLPTALGRRYFWRWNEMPKNGSGTQPKQSKSSVVRRSVRSKSARSRLVRPMRWLVHKLPQSDNSLCELLTLSM
jgi:hypothetical protein